MNFALRYTLFALIALAVTCHGCSGQEPSGAAPHAAPPSTMETEDSQFFIPQFVHLHPHALYTPGEEEADASSPYTFFDVNLFQLYVVAAVLVLFLLVAGSFRSSQSPWVIRVFRGWCHWLRDEVVYNVMGEKEGRTWAPFFIYLFFFIVFLNLVGLVPGSVTATACAFVTAGLALVIFVIMMAGGMIRQGPIAFWKNLLPSGLPVALIPLMFPIEVIGLVVKPCALTIRLFANMLAGHLLIYSFVGLIFVFAKMFELGAMSWLTVVPSVGMAVFINIIEALVVLLQAYIFTYLSVLFVQQSLHPEH